MSDEQNNEQTASDAPDLAIENTRLTMSLEWLMRHHLQEDNTYLVHNEVEDMLAGEKRFPTAIEAVEYIVSLANDL